MAGEVISAKLSQLEAFGIKVVTDFSALTARVRSLERAGGQPNIIEKILVNGIQLAVDGNKAVNFSVPTKTSQLKNDTDLQNGTQVNEKLSTKADSGHDHDGRYFTKEQVNSAIAGKADTGHTHDDRYYTEAEMDTKLGGKADAEHSHDDLYYAKSEVDAKFSDVAAPAWDSISGKPTAFTPTDHTHDDRYYTEAEIDQKLQGLPTAGHKHTKSDITDFPALGTAAAKNVGDFAASSHTHDDRYYTESEMNAKLNGKANASHTHDDRYYTESEMNTKLNGKANSSHTHNYAGSSSAGGTANSVNGLTFAAQTTDPGAGSSLATNKVLIVYQ
jgi:hypothetical protein